MLQLEAAKPHLSRSRQQTSPLGHDGKPLRIPMAELGRGRGILRHGGPSLRNRTACAVRIIMIFMQHHSKAYMKEDTAEEKSPTVTEYSPTSLSVAGISVVEGDATLRGPLNGHVSYQVCDQLAVIWV